LFQGTKDAILLFQLNWVRLKTFEQ
jgi:hypothetical protein